MLGEDGEKMDGRAGPRSESVVLQKSQNIKIPSFRPYFANTEFLVTCSHRTYQRALGPTGIISGATSSSQRRFTPGTSGFAERLSRGAALGKGMEWWNRFTAWRGTDG